MLRPHSISLFLAISAVASLQSVQAQPIGSHEARDITTQLQSGTTDTTSVRRLLRLGAFYLNKTLNPTSDLDSASLLAGQALDRAQRLGFAGGEEDAIFLKGRILIKHQDTAALSQMLPNVSVNNRGRLLLELGKSMLRTPYLQKSDREGALLFFREAEGLSKRTDNRKLREESQRLIGIVYLLNGDWGRAESYFMQVMKDCHQAGDKAGALRTLLRLATTVFCDSCAENISVLTRALELSRQIDDPAIEAIIRLEIGYKYLNGGNAARAEKEAQAALKIQQRIGYPAIYNAYKNLAMQSVYYTPSDYGYLSNAYYLLSDLGQSRGDLNQKLLYILEVVKDVESGDSQEELDYTYFRLGNAYWELGQFDKSMEYHRQSAAISRQKGDHIPVGLARRMTVALLEEGRPREALDLLYDLINKRLPCSVEDKMYIARGLGACFNKLQQYAKAEKYYLESVAFSKQLPMRFQFLADRGIAQFYVDNARYTKAEPYLHLLLNASRQQILPNSLIDVHLMRFKVDSANRNYSDAIRHYQQYKALQDSIYNETKSQQIAQLSIQYETARKEQDIELKEKNIALLREQNSAQEDQRNALIVGTGLLAALLALGLNRYRLKQRVNRQLGNQQRVLQTQQRQISEKNEHLSALISEKDTLLMQKDTLLGEKDQLLTEKEWLLKEIHHRVKNNFHIVASLLEIQSSYLKNKEALSAIRDSQHRIHSMSIIHQKLYQSDTLSTIQMSEYIYELVEYLRDSYAIREKVAFSLKIENIELDHASAITLGLILNEVITNAIKYAFANTSNGGISISLNHISDSQILLSIQDNGPGLPDDLSDRLGASMGMELLRGLTDDIGGQLSIESNQGTHVKIIFSYKALNAGEISVS